MGSPIGVISDGDAQVLTARQRADLRTYYIGQLVSSKEVIELAKKDPHLLLKIGDVAKNPDSLPIFMKEHENIRQIVENAARPIIDDLKKK